MKRTIIMVFAITVLVAAIAAAQPMNPGKMAEKLGLSDLQVEQMHSLQIKFQSDMIMRRAELKIAHLELREIMMNPNLNENAALSKQDQISKMRSDIAHLKIQHKIAMRKILNDEQLKKWQDDPRGKGPLGKRNHMDDRGFRGHGPIGPCDKSQMMGPGMGSGPGKLDKNGGERGE